MMHKRFRWHIGFVGSFMLLFTSLLGCYDYTPLQPTTQTGDFFWELKADHRAVLLSMTPPFNTLQLTATPYSVDGGALAIDTLVASPVVWESGDTTAVKISQTGVLSAAKIATRVTVYATMTIGEITRRDTIWVGVTATAPSTLDSLVLYVPNGKNTVAAGGTLSLAVRARLANSQLLSGVPVSYRANNRWLADFQGSAAGVLYGLIPEDSVYVFATATVYGVTKRDSLFLYTGMPVRLFPPVFVLESLLSNNRTLIYVPRITDLPSAPGSTFAWVNNSGLAPKNGVGYPRGGMNVDVIFDHPEVAEAFLPTSTSPLYNQSGNILQLASDSVQSPKMLAYRKFTQPGEHWYTVEPLGVRGKITIGVR
jgi:hypothetical protein